MMRGRWIWMLALVRAAFLPMRQSTTPVSGLLQQHTQHVNHGAGGLKAVVFDFEETISARSLWQFLGGTDEHLGFVHQHADAISAKVKTLAASNPGVASAIEGGAKVADYANPIYSEWHGDQDEAWASAVQLSGLEVAGSEGVRDEVFGGGDRVEMLKTHLGKLHDAGIEIYILTNGYASVINVAISLVGLDSLLPTSRVTGREDKSFRDTVDKTGYRKYIYLQDLKKENSWNETDLLFVDDREEHINPVVEHHVCRAWLVMGTNDALLNPVLKTDVEGAIAVDGGWQLPHKGGTTASEIDAALACSGVVCEAPNGWWNDTEKQRPTSNVHGISLFFAMLCWASQ